MDNAILNIVLQAKDEATQVLKQVGSQVDSAKDKVGQMGKAFTVAGGLMTAGGIAGMAMLKDWTSAAAEAEVQMAKFDAKLKASFGNAPEVMAKVKSSAEDVSKSFIKLGFDDETTANAFLGLASKVKDTAKATDLMGLAADMARAKGIGLSDATEQISKILMGKGNRALMEYGIVAKKGGDATEYLAQIQAKVAGQAKAYSETSVGANERLQVTMENLREELGAKLLPIIAKVATFFLNLVDKLNALNPNLLSTIGIVVAIGTAFALVVGPILTLVGLIGTFGAVFGAISSSILLPAIGIIAGVVAIALALWWAFNNWSTIQIVLTNLWNAIQQFAINTINTITTFLINLYNSVITFLTPIYTFFSTIFNAIWAVISYILNTIFTLFSFVFQGIWAIVQIVFFSISAFITEHFGGVFAFISKTLDNIRAITTSILNSVLSTFTSIFNSISNTIKSAMQQAVDWMSQKLNEMWKTVTDITKKIWDAFTNMANGIMSALRMIKFPHLNISLGEAEIAGHKIQYPKLNVDWYEKGGWVDSTGLAVVHQGEFVLSRDMLQGNVSIPNNVVNNNQPINIYATVNSDMDITRIGYQLAWILRNSR